MQQLIVIRSKEATSGGGQNGDKRNGVKLGPILAMPIRMLAAAATREPPLWVF